MDTITDTDTADEIVDAFRFVYRRALDLAAPRIWARMRTLVAADSTQQTITDDEWAEIVTAADDPVGDAVLDGAMAGVITLGALGSASVLAKRIVEHISQLTGYSPQLRASIDKWIDTTIADNPPDSLEQLVKLLEDDSPLSQDKADLVADTETQPAVNAGLHAGLEAAPPAAVRWVTQRDLRVRFAHAVADTDTIPYGQEFTIGGYPARYPGDPQLPFELRVNCRCYLAYVEGSEVRRAVGASKKELRQKANELDIFGRSKMNKGQLQFAVLKALCAQGLAGGPDCPDKFDQMNRTALVTLARGQGIVGRHRMSRQELLAALRDDLRGTDPGRVASGFSTRTEWLKAQKHATVKRRVLDDQHGDGKLPSLTARRAVRHQVFDEFDEGGGYVPCVHCGIRLHWDPTQGFSMLVPEPIVPWSEGGTMDLSNLLPSCPSCFRARGGRGLIASAAETTPRDYHGRWTKHEGDTVRIDEVDVPTRFIRHEGDYEYVDWSAWQSEQRAADDARRAELSGAQAPLSVAQSSALTRYQSTFGMYHDVNESLRHGTTPDFPTGDLDSAIAASRTPSDVVLHRGIQFPNRQAQAAFMSNVAPGAVLSDQAYASTSLDSSRAYQFAGSGERPGVLMEIRTPRGTPFVYLGDQESEVLLARDTPMRVVSVDALPSRSKFDNWAVVMEIVE